MKQHRTRATRRIRDVGHPARILRKSGGTTDGFGKTTGDSWAEVARERAVPNMGGGRRKQQLALSGGELDQSSPILTLVYDTAAQDGDRVEVEGVTYEIQTLVPYPTHTVARTVSVNGEL